MHRPLTAKLGPLQARCRTQSCAAHHMSCCFADLIASMVLAKFALGVTAREISETSAERSR